MCVYNRTKSQVAEKEPHIVHVGELAGGRAGGLAIRQAGGQTSTQAISPQNPLSYPPLAVNAGIALYKGFPLIREFPLSGISLDRGVSLYTAFPFIRISLTRDFPFTRHMFVRDFLS